MALENAGLGVLQSQPGKKVKPGRGAIGQAAADLRSKISMFISIGGGTARDDAPDSSRRGAEPSASARGPPNLLTGDPRLMV